MPILKRCPVRPGLKNSLAPCKRLTQSPCNPVNLLVVWPLDRLFTLSESGAASMESSSLRANATFLSTQTSCSPIMLTTLIQMTIIKIPSAWTRWLQSNSLNWTMVLIKKWYLPLKVPNRIPKKLVLAKELSKIVILSRPNWVDFKISENNRMFNKMKWGWKGIN